MAVRQLKIFVRPNKNIPFFPNNFKNDIQEHFVNYDQKLIKNGIVLKINTKLLGNKLVTETIYKDIDSFFSTCNDLSLDPKLNLQRLEITKYHAENNIIETQSRDFNYNFES